MAIRRSRHLMQPVATLRRSDKVFGEILQNPRQDLIFGLLMRYRSLPVQAFVCVCVTVRLATAKMGGACGKHGGIRKCVQDLD
jgi:hypothetical protein